MTDDKDAENDPADWLSRQFEPTGPVEKPTPDVAVEGAQDDSATPVSPVAASVPPVATPPGAEPGVPDAVVPDPGLPGVALTAPLATAPFTATPATTAPATTQPPAAAPPAEPYAPTMKLPSAESFFGPPRTAPTPASTPEPGVDVAAETVPPVVAPPGDAPAPPVPPVVEAPAPASTIPAGFEPPVARSSFVPVVPPTSVVPAATSVVPPAVVPPAGPPVVPSAFVPSDANPVLPSVTEPGAETPAPVLPPAATPPVEPRPSVVVPEPGLPFGALAVNPGIPVERTPLTPPPADPRAFALPEVLPETPAEVPKAPVAEPDAFSFTQVISTDSAADSGEFDGSGAPGAAEPAPAQPFVWGLQPGGSAAAPAADPELVVVEPEPEPEPVAEPEVQPAAEPEPTVEPTSAGAQISSAQILGAELAGAGAAAALAADVPTVAIPALGAPAAAFGLGAAASASPVEPSANDGYDGPATEAIAPILQPEPEPEPEPEPTEAIPEPRDAEGEAARAAALDLPTQAYSWELPPAVDTALEGATEAFAAQPVGIPEPVAESAPTSAIDSLFAEEKFAEFEPSGAVASASPVATDVPTRAAARSGGGTPPHAPMPRWQKILLWVAGSLVAVLALIALFLLGTRLSDAFAPAPVASPSPSATPSPTPTVAAVGPLAPGTYDWNKLLGSECLEPYVSPWEEEFTVVDCATPHHGQMLVRGLFPEDAAAAYPGVEELQTRINLLCTPPTVIDYTAAGAYPDIQIAASFAATEEEWKGGHRDYFCFASRSSGEPLTTSIAIPPVAPAAQ